MMKPFPSRTCEQIENGAPFSSGVAAIATATLAFVRQGAVAARVGGRRP